MLCKTKSIFKAKTACPIFRLQRHVLTFLLEHPASPPPVSFVGFRGNFLRWVLWINVAGITKVRQGKYMCDRENICSTLKILAMFVIGGDWG